MSSALFCEIQHGRCEQRDLADFAAMTSRENPLYLYTFLCASTLLHFDGGHQTYMCSLSVKYFSLKEINTPFYNK